MTFSLSLSLSLLLSFSVQTYPGAQKNYFIFFLSSFAFSASESEGESTIVNTTADGAFEGRQAGGSFIKGDPLNGYYDFVITEGSYKFWVVFQVCFSALKECSHALKLC
jgi:hypothetical protein